MVLLNTATPWWLCPPTWVNEPPMIMLSRSAAIANTRPSFTAGVIADGTGLGSWLAGPGSEGCAACAVGRLNAVIARADVNNATNSTMQRVATHFTIFPHNSEMRARCCGTTSGLPP